MAPPLGATYLEATALVLLLTEPGTDERFPATRTGLSPSAGTTTDKESECGTALEKLRGMSSTPSKYRVRECNGGSDYSAVISSVDAWWGGRQVSLMLPRLFFENFSDTTFVVETTQPAGRGQRTASNAGKGEGKHEVVGFLCGFVSQSRAGEVRRGSACTAV